MILQKPSGCVFCSASENQAESLTIRGKTGKQTAGRIVFMFPDGRIASVMEICDCPGDVRD